MQILYRRERREDSEEINQMCFMSQVSLATNCGCIVVAAIGAVLIVVDLAQWPLNKEFLKVRPLI